ncbi:hypothetical protein EPO17_03380 [Patescibacteria group bacterium]|nr:MAG: hypothetical protein EPO17_03380 [Patescibacteria group bacterium]
MNIRVLVARILVVVIVFFGLKLTFTSSLWWAPAFWAISGVLACIVSRVWDIFTNPFDLAQMIATIIVGCIGGFIFLLVMATEHEDDKVSRTPR